MHSRFAPAKNSARIRELPGQFSIGTDPSKWSIFIRRQQLYWFQVCTLPYPQNYFPWRLTALDGGSRLAQQGMTPLSEKREWGK